MISNLNKIIKCEVCGSSSLESVLDLGVHPMCDDLVPIGSCRVCVEYPIEIVYCSTCCTAHQKYQVPKASLFPKTYHYRSRFTSDVLNGMKDLVQRCEALLGSLKTRKVLDVGCNDGSLLGIFREKGATTLGIEPTGACADAKAQGHITFNNFLSPELADHIVSQQGYPDLIVFTNVFAHIEDLRNVLESLRRLMSKTTAIIIENHYLGSVLGGNQFDTFYHEHPRTYSYTSFLQIARSLDLSLVHAEFPSRYGGNIRVFLTPTKNDSASQNAKILKREKDFNNQFMHMSSNIVKWQSKKKNEIIKLVNKLGPLKAKAFPGRAAILVKLLGLNDNQLEAVHEKPGSMKIGHYVPGTRIPIISDDDLWNSPDKKKPLINMAWHISKEIRTYLSKAGYPGSVIDILSLDDFSD